MPVSKKRKKAGKPVQRKEPVVVEGSGHEPAPEPKPGHPALRMGKPSNPFVTQQQGRRGAQRGR
jgi:hypothetical protein